MRKQEQISKVNLKMLESADEYQKLLHRVFVESKQGAELLSMWKDLLVVTDGHAFGKDPYDLGRTEGRKEFVREILLLSKQAEDR